MDIHTCPTIIEQILTMSEDDLEKCALGCPLTVPDSSRLEGLVVDQDLLKDRLLADYRLLRAKNAKVTLMVAVDTY